MAIFLKSADMTELEMSETYGPGSIYIEAPKKV
jgi:hypothetical protein